MREALIQGFTIVNDHQDAQHGTLISLNLHYFITYDIIDTYVYIIINFVSLAYLIISNNDFYQITQRPMNHRFPKVTGQNISKGFYCEFDKIVQTYTHRN